MPLPSELLLDGLRRQYLRPEVRLLAGIYDQLAALNERLAETPARVPAGEMHFSNSTHDRAALEAIPEAPAPAERAPARRKPAKEPTP